ncbi:hypothetical protein [Caldanaerobacter subterraneus]|uniref:DUF4258 domain-containing protein n=1 Tax=Caldanaerobacter subterraneus TaxID=911092 RepID=A0A4R2K4U0_9THEO|nr:hypothetical protein [Caldanaerobacter subterraneus]TCO68213.1 hypothetical protein EV203_103110 [Caldanaerobacter subterraneus]
MSKRREYTVFLWGKYIKVVFTDHALKRLEDRTSLMPENIIQSIKAAESKIKKLRGKQRRFAVFDYVLKTAYMAVFDNPNSVAIITVYKDTNTWIEGGPDIIVRTKKELRRYVSV